MKTQKIEFENTALEVSILLDELNLDVETHNKLAQAIILQICATMDKSFSDGYVEGYNDALNQRVTFCEPF